MTTYTTQIKFTKGQGGFLPAEMGGQAIGADVYDVICRADGEVVNSLRTSDLRHAEEIERNWLNARVVDGQLEAAIASNY
jgi:hypothetical protein